MRVLGATQWWMDARGAVVGVAAVDGATIPCRIGVAHAELTERRYGSSARTLVARAHQYTTTLTAVCSPDVAVLSVACGDTESKVLRFGGLERVAMDGVISFWRLDSVRVLAALPLDGELRRAGLRLPAGGGDVLFGVGTDRRELASRLRAFAPAARDAHARADTRARAWLRQGTILRSPSAELNRAIGRALEQLRCQVDSTGRVLDVLARGSVEPLSGTTTEVAAALALFGHVRLARRVLQQARRRARADPVEAARLHRFTALGWLPGKGVDLAPHVVVRPSRTPESGGDRIVSLRDWLDVELEAQRELPPVAHYRFDGGGRNRLLASVKPREGRVVPSLLLLGSVWRPLPADWRVTARRTAPQVLEQLLHGDGTLGLRGRWPGGAAAIVESSAWATACLAEWRLARGDRAGAWRAVRAALACGTDLGLPLLCGKAPRRSKRSRSFPQLSAKAAAAFLLAALGLVARREGAFVRVGLPPSWGAATLERVRVGQGFATLRLEREAAGLRVFLRGAELPGFQLASFALATDTAEAIRLPKGGTSRQGISLAAPEVFVPQLSGGLRLPKLLQHYADGGQRYDEEFTEVESMLAYLLPQGTVRPQIRRLKSGPSPEAAARELHRLRALARELERRFELRAR